MNYKNEPIKSIEQAKRYFISNGCSHFYMTRENPERYEEYRALDIDRSIESEWIREEFDKELENFHSISPNDYGHFLRKLDSMIDRKVFYLEKLFELVSKIQERLPLNQIDYILLTIIGNNATKTKGGLIQKSYDLKRKDLAKKFFDKAKYLIKTAEENSISLTFIRGYLIDVIEYYGIEESKEYIEKLRKKDYSENFIEFEKGANEGNKYSMKRLSEYYREGKGCKKDIEKADYWELKAQN